MATITTIKERIISLDSAGFQILCDDYLSRIGYPNLVALGTMAGARRTTKGTPDTYFCEKNGKYVFAEYTVQRDALVKKIKSDIEKCLDEEKTHIPLDKISEIVYCHTSSNLRPDDDNALKVLCSDKGILLSIIGIDKLADDIFWYYKTLAKEHLGLMIDTEQIQTADDFVKKYDANTLAASLNTSFVGRDKELTEISDAFSNVKAVIVSGAAGVGKTRLCLEFAKRYAGSDDRDLFCIHNRSLGLNDDLCMYFEKPGKYFILVDDANQITQLNLIIELINKNPEHFDFRILITVRDYALNKIKDTLASMVSFKEVKIEKFKDEEIQALVSSHFGIKNEQYLNRIVTIAEGNARLAMMAGDVAVKTNRLDSIYDASNLLDTYYGTILQGTGLATDKGLIATAGVSAFLGSFHLDSLQNIVVLLEEIGMDRDSFVENLFQLSDLEIVDIFYDKAIRFSEQSFANYILKYAFCDKKVLSLSKMIKECFFINRERTLFAVNTLLRVFCSEQMNSFLSSEIISIWNELQNEDQDKFWLFLKAFYPVNPIETLSLIKKIIENTEAIILSAEKIDTEAGKNYQSIKDDIITILCGYSDHEDLDAALDLFFQYYLKRPDKYIQFFHAATGAFCIQPKSEQYGFYTQIHFFSKLYEYSDNWNNDHLLILFLDCAKEFLQIHFNPHDNSRNGKAIVFYQIELCDAESVSVYRNPIWEQLKCIAKRGLQPGRLREVLKRYGHIIHDDSADVIRNESAFVCDVIKFGLSFNDIEDCIIVKRIADCFNRYSISTEEIKPFLNSDVFQSYQILIGPDWSEERDYRKRHEVHETMIQTYLNSGDCVESPFSKLFDVFSCLNKPNYNAIIGINMAVQKTSDVKETYINVIRYIIKTGKYSGIRLDDVVRTLFQFLSSQEVYSFIRESITDEESLNCWLYEYYCNLPQDMIDTTQLNGLYDYLQNQSDASITSSSLRDITFLKKYQVIEKDVFIKALRIILSKYSYSPFIVKVYCQLMFNPCAKSKIDLTEEFQDNIDLLEDAYFFLLQNKPNEDYEGAFLLQMAKKDKSFPKRLAKELLLLSEKHFLFDIDSRYCALYGLDNYIEVFDIFVDETIRIARCPILSVPDIIKQLLILPEKRTDLETKRNDWVKHHIDVNNQDKNKMDALFDAISDCSLDLRQKSIEWFVQRNKNFEDFKNLSLFPRITSAVGSFVPVHKKQMDFLTSLLPLFQGINFIDHKKYINDRIESIRLTIKQEEISDILTG